MLNNNEIILDIFKELKNMYINKEFIIDKSGVKTLEFINKTITLNPIQPNIDIGIRKTNEKYVQKELDWYLSQDLNVYPQMSDITIWTKICDKEGFINSNYGWCVFSKENGNQYKFVLEELKNNSSSRRACMIYNRPSITTDYCFNGRSDYICTMYTAFFIRNNKLIYNVKQRSCDIVYGFFNDFAWHCYIYNKVYMELKNVYKDLEIGSLNYNFDSLHIYEKHFKLFDKI